jgi:ornithine--oxo-acid transaminase
LIKNAQVMGEYIMDQLSKLPQKNILEIRGKGLLIGIELKHEVGGARQFAEILKEKGILIKETSEHVIRIAPPLILDQETADWMISVLRDVL